MNCVKGIDTLYQLFKVKEGAVSENKEKVAGIAFCSCSCCETMPTEAENLRCKSGKYNIKMPEGLQ